MKTTLGLLGLTGPLLVLCASCDERFEFDRPAAVASESGASNAGSAGLPAGSGGPAGGAMAAASVAGSGGVFAGAGGQSGVSGAAGGCGLHGACPGTQRCIEGNCYECELHVDCFGGRFAACHPERHRCVECVAPGDCGPDAVCDFRTNRCVQTCEDEIDCPAATPACEGGLCVSCDGDRHCEQSPLGRYCAADGRGCAECRDADDCPEQCNTLWGRCVECLDGRDCDSGFCDSAGVCVP